MPTINRPARHFATFAAADYAAYDLSSGEDMGWTYEVEIRGDFDRSIAAPTWVVACYDDEGQFVAYLSI